LPAGGFCVKACRIAARRQPIGDFSAGGKPTAESYTFSKLPLFRRIAPDRNFLSFIVKLLTNSAEF
jgi:hypothetical protein